MMYIRRSQMEKRFNWNLDKEKERIKQKKDNIILIGAGNNAIGILFWLKD